MMRLIVIVSGFILALQVNSQTYTHPTTGIALENVGSCLVATCSGTYYDNGGAAGNYSNGIGGIYRVFCPDQPGNCLTATFTQFSVDTSPGCMQDALFVLDGSTQNSPLIWGGCGTGSIGPFTGTANGCLGFRFYSNNANNAPGWTATFSCAPCPNGPSATSNSDCVNATFLCDNTAVPGTSSGPGLVSEACTGSGCPAGGENYSNWYVVQFQSAGTFTFEINPQTASDDYDYAVYGPNVACNALGTPLRCSDSGLSGATGLSAAASDFTEDVLGDKWTAQLNVQAGESYYIMVDEWSPSGVGYTLSFGGTAVMSCTAVPVTLVQFDAQYDPGLNKVELTWITANERDCDYFEVQRSLDAEHFDVIDRIAGQGTRFEPTAYKAVDELPFPGEINYYRLRQVDTNGLSWYSHMQAVAINDPDFQFSVHPNPAREQATIRWMCARPEHPYHLQLIDNTGRIRNQWTAQAEKGLNTYTISLSDVSPGVYFIALRNVDGVLRKAVVKE